MTALSTIATELSQRFGNTDSENTGTSLCWLTHEGVIAVDGQDAERFLQGQLTCDAAKLAPDQSTLGARCNPKGRMQSSFRLQRTDSGFLLSMARELIAPQLADLGKYAAFFKTALSDQSDHWIRLGLWGEAIEQTLAAAALQLPAEANQLSVQTRARVLRLSDGACEIWLSAENALEITDQLLRHSNADSTNHWLLRQIQAGIGQVTGPTLELFIPQMLNMQQLGGVSFKKGCYTGQEIVARMQYLGKLKRRMYRLLMAGDVPPDAGTPIINGDSGKTVGEVVISAKGRQRVEMLAVLQKDAAQSVTLSAGDSQGPLVTLGDLPYESELTANEEAAQ
ncbi:MAG TPA: folate-binding protein [Pseudomonas sabulinigri]|uniref:GCVT N-terminal domain-containing protein n=1 Tax=marine sediment metagenome TaxID=412755 RepID=A0A0F9V5G3_9ZZZZ|nr:folate-binding protein [Halopseudomonas sabulinigri]HEC51377.1 folate-binding protein [Halopseudomonas sabulinigri]